MQVNTSVRQKMRLGIFAEECGMARWAMKIDISGEVWVRLCCVNKL
jgi:hypothetical protein